MKKIKKKLINQFLLKPKIKNKINQKKRNLITKKRRKNKMLIKNKKIKNKMIKTSKA